MMLAARRWIAVTVIAASGLFGNVNADAAGYPKERQFREAIEDVAGVVRAEGMALKVLDAQKEGLSRPLLSATFDIASNACMVFFDTRPENSLTQFFASLTEPDMALILRAISVHEMAHCVEKREAYVRQRFDKVLPDSYKPSDMTTQGYISVVESGALENWGEALADISSVLYLKRADPGRWRYLARRISTMRQELAAKWPQHDTSPWLNRLIDADPEIGTDANLFDMAFKYRKLFRPH